jgi:16S rRNA (guanine527-N7)-methyltransferase
VSSSPPPDGADQRLVAVLERARELGFLGPGPIEAHLANAAAFARVCGTPPVRALDLGSGGGVPGLVLASSWAASTWVLLDAMVRRCAFLRGAVAELGLAERVRVIEDRAERTGREEAWRGTFDLVTARSFARPAVTAECAAPFLRVGGTLLVSEPPDEPDRWEGVALLGLEDRGLVGDRDTHIRVLAQVAPCEQRYPRRVGVPEKRPLW